jgi:hypothetical protein
LLFFSFTYTHHHAPLLPLSPPSPPPPKQKQDTLSLGVTVIKRGDIETVQSIRVRKLDLTIRVKITTLLAGSGYSDPLQFYNAFVRQLYAAKQDGTLNRYLQAAAVTNGVEAFSQAYVKAYAVPNRYMINGESTSVVIPAGDTGEQPKQGMPLGVLIPSVLVAVMLFVAMVAFARQRARAFEQQLQQQQQLAVIGVVTSMDEREEEEGEEEELQVRR